MKIIMQSRSEWNGERYVTVHEESFDYVGPIAETKGDGTAKDQLKLQNQLQQEAFNLEKQRQAQVSAAMAPFLTSEGQGYTDAQLSTLRSTLLNQLATSYNGAAKNTTTALARRGSISSTNPVGGDFVRGIAGLEGAAASDRAAGLSNIELQNTQQALTNKFQAGNLVSGNAATLAGNVGQFGSGASNALNQYVYASNTGFGNAFTTAFGGALGRGVVSGIGAQATPNSFLSGFSNSGFGRG